MNKKPQGGEFYDLPQAAEVLGVGVVKLRRLIKQGHLPVVVLGPRTRRIPRDALVALALAEKDGRA